MQQLLVWLDARRDVWQGRRWRRGSDEAGRFRRGTGSLNQVDEGNFTGIAGRTQSEADVKQRNLTPLDDYDDRFSTANLYRVANEPAERITALESRLAELDVQADETFDDKPYLLPANHEGWLTTAQSARYLGCQNSSTLRSMVSRGDIVPDGKIGKGFRFEKQTLDAFVRQGRADGAGADRALRAAGRSSRGTAPATTRHGKTPTDAGPGDSKAPTKPSAPPVDDPFAPPASYVFDRDAFHSAATGTKRKGTSTKKG